jgi:tetratricopeptide (TPR) repeat protein
MAAMVAGFAGLYASQVRRAPLCPSAQPQLAGVWDADRKAAIARALQASGKPWAGETASRIAGEIDRYGREWVAMRREACEATSVRHEQSEALLDLRMRCLDERLEEVRSLASQLSQPDEALLDAATTAVYSLAPMRDCADTKALLAPVPLPGDPAVRAEVEQVRASLTEAKAMSELGRYAEAEPLAAELVGRARALRYSPAEAETLEVWADALESLGQYPRAVETYREALFAAERGLDRTRAASAMINLLWIVGVDQGHHEAAHEYAAHAAAVLAGLGGDAVLEADLDSHEAGVFREEGHFDEAVKLAREVVEKRKVAFGTMHPRYAMALNNLAASLADQGRYPESLAASQEALAINAQTLGEHHPDYALSLQSVASDYNLLGRPAEARTLAGQALAVLEEALGTEHARVASAEWALALIEMKLDEGADAERHLRHAMAVAEKLQGPDQNAVAEYTSVLGDLLVREGRYAEAVPLYRRSLAIQAAAGQEPAECRAGLGYALLGVGQRAAALRELETALQWQETNHGTKRDLGQARLGVSRALSALGTDPKRAHALAEQAVEAYAADPGTDAELRVARDWLRGLDGGGATASAGH